MNFKSYVFPVHPILLNIEKHSIDLCTFCILTVYDDILSFYNSSLLTVPLFIKGYVSGIRTVAAVCSVISPMATNSGHCSGNDLPHYVQHKATPSVLIAV